MSGCVYALQVACLLFLHLIFFIMASWVVGIYMISGTSGCDGGRERLEPGKCFFVSEHDLQDDGHNGKRAESRTVMKGLDNNGTTEGHWAPAARGRGNEK